MRKKIYIVAFISILIAFAGAFSLRTSEIEVVSTSYMTEDGSIHYLEGGLQLNRLSPDGKILFQKKLEYVTGDKVKSYANINADNDGNTYLLVNENKIVENYQHRNLQWIQPYNQKGVEQEKLFEFKADDSKQWIYAMQIVNDTLHVFTVYPVKNMLVHEMYDLKTKKTVEKDYIFDSLPKFFWIKATATGSLYYLTVGDRDLYCLNNSTTGAVNKKIDLDAHGMKNVIPGNITSDKDGNIYFEDQFNLGLLKYDEKTDTVTRLYSGTSKVAEGYNYEDLTYGKIENGRLYTLMNTAKTNDNYFFVYEDDKATTLTHKYQSLEKTMLSALMMTLIAFAVLFVLLQFFIWLFSNRSVLIKQLSMVLPIMCVGGACIGYYFFIDIQNTMKRESALQLYTITINMAQNLDKEGLENMKLPVPLDHYNFVNIENSANINIRDFYDIVPRALDKDFFYMVYIYQDGDYYKAFQDYAGNMSRERGIHEYATIANTRIWSDFANDSEDGTLSFRMKQGEDTKQFYCSKIIYSESGDILGKVEVGIDYWYLEGQIERIIYKFLLTIVCVFALALLLMALALKKTLRGLKLITSAVNDMAEGNWNTMVHIKSNDEMEDVGNAFNKMAIRIKGYFFSIESLNNAFQKFVQRDMFRILKKDSILDASKGDCIVEEMNIISVNAREFYNYTSNMSREENFAFINHFYGVQSFIVKKYGGFIEEFYGEGFRAVIPSSVDTAIDCVIEIMERFHMDQGLGIAVSAIIQNSEVMFGIVGNEASLDFVAVSEALNYTDIIRNAKDQNELNLVITSLTYEKIQNKEKYSCRYVGKLKDSRSSQQDFELYDVLNAYPFAYRNARERSKDFFEKGVSLYISGELSQARKCFIDVVKMDQNDKLAQAYIFLCDKYKTDMPTPWNGDLKIEG